MAIFNRKQNKEKMPGKQLAGLNVLFTNIKKIYVKYMTNLGAHVFHYGKFSVIKAFEMIIKTCRFLAVKTVCIFKKLGGSVLKLVKHLTAKPVTCIKAFGDSVLAKKKSKGLVPAIGHGFSYLGKSAWHSKGILVKSFNYVAPVVAIVFFVSLITYAKDEKYAISVECNGKVVGYIKDEGVADEAQQILQERINYVEGDKEIIVQPKLSVKKLSSEATIYDGSELAEKMIKYSDADLEDGYGIYINEKFQGAVKDGTKIKSSLNSILSKYSTGNSSDVAEFVDKVEIKEGLYLKSGIISEDEFVNKISSNKQVDAYYTIVKGDAPSLIAQKVGIPYSKLKSMNPKIETDCFIGQKVLINRSQPFLSVKITKEIEYDESIAYSTEKVSDPTMYKGNSKVLVTGQNGLAHIKANVSIIDGSEDSRTIISKDIIKPTVNQKVAQGSKPNPGFSDASYSSVVASGDRMLWPTGGGRNYITTHFMHYGHRGIDIASSGVHLPIYAAQEGTVIEACWRNSYGKTILISHGNGLTTRYAHMTQLNVAAGTHVSKGQVIGVMGNTGNSYGVHLHFEVQQYGRLLNPLNFLR